MARRKGRKSNSIWATDKLGRLKALEHGHELTRAEVEARRKIDPTFGMR